MTHQFTTLVSVALVELIVNDVPATIVGTDKFPWVPPGVLTLTKIFDEDVTAVVLTVTVPAESVAVPTLAFDPVVKLIFPATLTELFARSTRNVFIPSSRLNEKTLLIPLVGFGLKTRSLPFHVKSTSVNPEPPVFISVL